PHLTHYSHLSPPLPPPLPHYAPQLLRLSYSIDLAPAQLSTLSLHDALPICEQVLLTHKLGSFFQGFPGLIHEGLWGRVLLCDFVDRKSTRLNSSHLVISYAVFCLKKKMVTALQHAENAHHGAGYFKIIDAAA